MVSWLSYVAKEREWNLINYFHIFMQQNPSWAATTYSEKSPPFTRFITELSLPYCKMCSILLDLIILMSFGKMYKHQSSALIPYAIKPINLTLLLPKLSSVSLFKYCPSILFQQSKRPGFIFMLNNRQNYISSYFYLDVSR